MKLRQLRQLYLDIDDIASLFVGEEYERQLQEALPKMPSGFENKKIVLSWKTSQRTSLTSWWMVSLWMFGFGPPCMIGITTLGDRKAWSRRPNWRWSPLAAGEWSEPTIWRSFPSGDFSANQLFILWNFETHRLPTTEKSVFTHV